MMRSLKNLIGYKILSIKDGGKLGMIKDFYFDDISWTIRYLIADTGSWLSDRRVLISPHSFGQPDWGLKMLPVDLTKDQVENCPPIDKHKPVSEQHETELVDYFGWPNYWSVMGVRVPGVVYPPGESKNKKDQNDKKEPSYDHNLRSTNEVIGYHIQTMDGDLGHVEDFIADEGSWHIRYGVVDTKNWLPGRKVLIAIAWIDRVSWKEKKVFVNLTREKIKNSPTFDPFTPVNRRYEEMLHDYYGKARYWN
jgi:uncharacterized protein YrrD